MFLFGKIFRAALFLTAVAYLASMSASAQTTPPVTVIEGGTVIDGTGAAPIADAVVVIRGNRISAVGRAGAVEIPAGAQRIDAKGRFVIPGLIDAHAHLKDWMNELYLVQGVTSVLAVASPTDWAIAQKEGVEKGRIRGPRVFPSGANIQCAGRVCQTEAFSPDGLRQQVRERAAAGLDHLYAGQEVPAAALKIIIEEAHAHNLPVSGPNFYSREGLAAGQDLLVHTYSIILAAIPQDQRDKLIASGNRRAAVLENGIDPIDYLGRAEGKELLAQLARNKTRLIPMLAEDMKSLQAHQARFTMENAALLDKPELDYVPKSELYPQVVSPADAGVSRLAMFRWASPGPNSPQERKFQEDYRTIQGFVREFVSMGGKVMAASDTPNFALPGVGLYHDMELLVDAGLSPMQVLQAATLWPAEYVKKEKDVGSIQPGRFADLVVLDGNPLEDILNVKRIRMVMRNGSVEDLRLHRGYFNPIPFPPTPPPESPRVREITPSLVAQQSGAFHLTVKGTGFFPASVLQFDGVSVPVESAKNDELRATIPAELTERVGTFGITVRNPGAPEEVSNAAYLIVKFK